MTLTSFGVLLANDLDGHHGAWGGGWMWLWGTLMMIAFVALVGFAVWALARTQRPDQPDRRPDPTARAREILAERYARGEISGEEYREKIEELR